LQSTTYHLTPAEIWTSQQSSPTYVPEAFEADGFIHCTDGEDAVIEVGNRYYVSDPRSYVVLSIRCEDVEPPIRYEDPNRVYPHIYGALNIDAVVAVRGVSRDAAGTFLAIVE
jgi:uncharacterized protein (DUF952 family)